jgi:hypothetical protein
VENRVILADESACFRVIIPALQIIQSAFGVVIISAVTHAGVPTNKNRAAGLITDENYVVFQTDISPDSLKLVNGQKQLEIILENL